MLPRFSCQIQSVKENEAAMVSPSVPPMVHWALLESLTRKHSYPNFE